MTPEPPIGQTFQRPGGVWSDLDLQVLELVSRSAPQAEVAARLGCSVATVERRLALLRERLGVETTIQVVVAAVRDGVI